MNSSQKQLPANDKKVSDVFNPRDFSIFKWTICRYMCESKDTMFSEQQIFLYLRDNLRGYMQEDYMRDFLSGNSGNIIRRFLKVIQTWHKGILWKYTEFHIHLASLLHI